MKKKTYEEYMVEINATGAFVEGTTFTLLPKDESGRTDKWIVYCPICAQDDYAEAGVCDGNFKTFTGNLVKGVKPCRCSNKPQYTNSQWTYRVTKALQYKSLEFVGWVGDVGNKKGVIAHCREHGCDMVIDSKDIMRGFGGCRECNKENKNLGYISYVLNEDGEPYALKFGITANTETREVKLNSCNQHQVRMMKVFRFPSSRYSRAAETTIKRTFKDYAVERQNFPYGFTETLPMTYINSIIQIFQEFGGEEE